MTRTSEAKRFRRCLVLSCALLLGCEHKAPPNASVASAAVSSSANPKIAPTTHFAVQSAGSSVSFSMDSPLEKIQGVIDDALVGNLDVELSNIEHSTGTLEVDLDKLSLLEQKRKDEKHVYSESARNEQQNREAREWLQLEAREGEIAEEQAKRNRFPKFTLDRLDNPSAVDVQSLSGSERNVGAAARGSFLLHGRTNKKTLKLSLTFVYAGERIEQIRVKTSEPFPVALEEYDINPRNRAGKLIKTIQEALSSDYRNKLRAEALVEVSFTAKPM